MTKVNLHCFPLNTGGMATKFEIVLEEECQIFHLKRNGLVIYGFFGGSGGSGAGCLYKGALSHKGISQTLKSVFNNF